jgi:hypothetical protein
MWNWFNKKNLLQCGGEGLCEIVVHGKVCGTIRYRRPTSDEKLDYVYQLQKGLGTESQLKEIAADKDNKAKKCHEILIRDLSIPMAKVIFLGSTGFSDEKMNPIDSLEIDKQFEIISKYYGYALVDLVAFVYATEGVVKKKY